MVRIQILCLKKQYFAITDIVITRDYCNTILNTALQYSLYCGLYYLVLFIHQNGAYAFQSTSHLQLYDVS